MNEIVPYIAPLVLHNISKFCSERVNTSQLRTVWKFTEYSLAAIYVKFFRMEFKEQRCDIKFSVKLQETGAEMVKMLKELCGDATMYRSKIYEWFKRKGEDLLRIIHGQKDFQLHKFQRIKRKLRHCSRFDRCLAIRNC